MSNVIYEDKFYNEKVKYQFMDDNNYAKGTRQILSRIFKVSCSLETDLGKDLYDFSREELKKLFYLFMAKTAYSSRANCTWVSKYLNWTRESNIVSGENPLETVDKEWKEQFVNKSIKKYWTDKEIDKIISKRVNAQDAVVVSLLFNGVRGTANAEILNLHKNDVDAFNERLHLNDNNGNKRTIKVSEKCIGLCQAALKQDDYEKMNGNASKDIKSPTAHLVVNDFVVKSSNTRTEHLYEAEKNIVHRRLSNIANEEGEPQFIPTNLVNSGMLYMAKNLYLESGKLEDEEYKKISEQFNVPMDQSMLRMKQEFLNLDFVKEFYELT